MLNEKQTDTVGWKKKLEDMDSLPGEAPAGNHVAWEKLHNRLHEAPGRKKTAWYWAAACLLLLAAFPFVIRKASIQAPLKDLVHQKQLLTPAAPVVLIDAARQPLITSKSIVKNKARSFTINPNRHNSIKDTVRQQEAMVVTALQPDTLTNQPDEDSAGKTPAVVTTAAVKKKLPLVHINELGKQEQENAKFASHNSWPSFQIKFLNQDNTSGATLPAVNAAQDMLKIKIPLKN